MHYLHRIEIDVVNPRIEQTLGKTMIAGNSNIINCSVHHYYCRVLSLELNSSVVDEFFWETYQINMNFLESDQYEIMG